MTSVIARLLDFEHILPRIWDEAKFASSDDGDQDKALDEDDRENLNLTVLTDAIRNPRWWGYTRMLWALHSWTAKLESWAEDCSCHSFLRPERGRHGKATATDVAIRSETCRRDMLDNVAVRGGPVFDGPVFACPLRGKRAVELARGSMADTMSRLAESVSTALLLELPSGLAIESVRHSC